VMTGSTAGMGQIRDRFHRQEVSRATALPRPDAFTRKVEGAALRARERTDAPRPEIGRPSGWGVQRDIAVEDPGLHTRGSCDRSA
jgi:hypothetical protein